MRCIVLICFTLLMATPVWAALEWSTGPEFKLPEEPVAFTESADGTRLFILTGKSSVLVYGANGQQETKIPLSFQADSIAISKDGERLLLGEKDGKRIRTLSLLERAEIPIIGSPFKGPADVAVAVVVFSDFQ